LVELLKDARLVFHGNARPCVDHTDGEVTIADLRARHCHRGGPGAVASDKRRGSRLSLLPL
jgi:hypothetical protein